MDGIWVVSQEEDTMTFVKTFEVWESGRIVARFGKDYKHLGDYPTKSYAQSILRQVENHIEDSKKPVFRMPKA